jgi:hypothetical protein
VPEQSRSEVNRNLTWMSPPGLSKPRVCFVQSIDHHPGDIDHDSFMQVSRAFGVE